MKGNPWAFGILFFSVCCYLFWNNFELPSIFIGETKSTTAIVIKSQAVPTFHQGQRQMITFAFRVKDSIYTFKKKLSPRKTYQAIGSKLQIKYSVSDPSHFKIDKYFKQLERSEKLSFFWNNEYYTEEIHLINQVAFTERKTIKDSLIDRKVNAFIIEKDSLYIMPLLFSKSDSTERVFTIEGKGKNEIIRELKTGNIFR